MRGVRFKSQVDKLREGQKKVNALCRRLLAPDISEKERMLIMESLVNPNRTYGR